MAEAIGTASAVLQIAAVAVQASKQPQSETTVTSWMEALKSEQAKSFDTVSLSASTFIQPASIKDSDLHLAEELVEAARRGTMPFVKLLLECVNVKAQYPRYGRTALSVAAEMGDVTTATLLLDHGTWVHTRQYSRSYWYDDWGPHWMAGCTPLGWAAFCGASDLVELLLKPGANPNSATSGGRSALQDAC